MRPLKTVPRILSTSPFRDYRSLSATYDNLVFEDGPKQLTKLLNTIKKATLSASRASISEEGKFSGRKNNNIIDKDEQNISDTASFYAVMFKAKQDGILTVSNHKYSLIYFQLLVKSLKFQNSNFPPDLVLSEENIREYHSQLVEYALSILDGNQLLYCTRLNKKQAIKQFIELFSLISQLLVTISTSIHQHLRFLERIDRYTDHVLHIIGSQTEREPMKMKFITSMEKLKLDYVIERSITMNDYFEASRVLSQAVEDRLYICSRPVKLIQMAIDADDPVGVKFLLESLQLSSEEAEAALNQAAKSSSVDVVVPFYNVFTSNELPNVQLNNDIFKQIKDHNPINLQSGSHSISSYLSTGKLCNLLTNGHIGYAVCIDIAKELTRRGYSNTTSLLIESLSRFYYHDTLLFIQFFNKYHQYLDNSSVVVLQFCQQRTHRKQFALELFEKMSKTVLSPSVARIMIKGLISATLGVDKDFEARKRHVVWKIVDSLRDREKEFEEEKRRVWIMLVDIFVEEANKSSVFYRFIDGDEEGKC